MTNKYIYKEQLDINGQNLEKLVAFNSAIDHFDQLNRRIGKINSISAKEQNPEQSKKHLAKVLNLVLQKKGLGGENIGENSKLYFKEINHELLLVANTVINGKPRNSQEDITRAMKVLDGLIGAEGEQGFIDSGKIKSKYGMLLASHQGNLNSINTEFRKNTNLVSKTVDKASFITSRFKGNVFKDSYQNSYNQTKDQAYQDYLKFLKEFGKVRKTLSAEDLAEMNKIKQGFQSIMDSKIRELSFTSIDDIAEMERNNLKEVKDGTIQKLIFEGFKGEGKGIYDATIGIGEIILKICTAEEPIITALGAIKKILIYIKEHSSIEGVKSTYTEAMKIFSRELQKIKGLPPEKQAHMIGELAGNIMGTILFTEGMGVVFKGSLTRIKYADGISSLEKIHELRSISNWNQLEKYASSIEKIRGAKDMTGHKLTWIIKQVQKGNMAVGEIPNVAGLKEKAIELLNYNGKIIKKEGFHNAISNKVADVTLDMTIKSKDAIKNSKLINAIADSANNSKAGKLVNKGSNNLINGLDTQIQKKLKKSLEKGLLKCEEGLHKMNKITEEIAQVDNNTLKKSFGLAADNRLRMALVEVVDGIKDAANEISLNFSSLPKEMLASKGLLNKIDAVISSLGDSFGNASKIVKAPTTGFASDVTNRFVIEPLVTNIKNFLKFEGELEKMGFSKRILKKLKEAVIENDRLRRPMAYLKYTEGNVIDSKIINGVQKNGYKNHKGELLGKGYAYDYAGDFTDGYAVMSIEGKNGVVDALGKEILSAKYDKINIKNGLAMIEQTGYDGTKYTGVMDLKTNKFMIPMSNETKDFLGGKIIKVKGGYRVANDNLFISKDVFVEIRKEQRMCFGKMADGRWKVINGIQNSESEIFTEINEVGSKKLFMGKLENGNWKIINCGGDIRNASYDNLHEFGSGLVSKTDGGLTLINDMGYSNEGFFEEAMMYHNKELIHIDRNLKITKIDKIPGIEDTGDFLVKSNGEWRYVAKYGSIIDYPPENVIKCGNSYKILTTKNARKGGQSAKGELSGNEGAEYKFATGSGKIIKGTYDRIEDIGMGHIVYNGEQKRFVTISGTLIKEPIIGDISNLGTGIRVKSEYGCQIYSMYGEKTKEFFDEVHALTGNMFIGIKNGTSKLILPNLTTYTGSYKSIINDGKEIIFENLEGKATRVSRAYLERSVNIYHDSGSLIYTAAVINENKDNIKKSINNIRRDYKVMTSEFIGQESKHIQTALESSGAKFDLFMTGNIINRDKMSISTSNLLSKFSKIKDKDKLAAEIKKTVDEAVNIYIEDINAKRGFLNIERARNGQAKLDYISEHEIAWINKNYKPKMEADFIQALEERIMLESGDIASMSERLGNPEKLSKMIGKFVERGVMNEALYNSLGSTTIKVYKKAF